ncbi:MAG: hypothetical protein AB8B53_05160 [Flavobacteriales bacterium]
MNGTQAKKIIIEYGEPKFLELGYSLKKTRDTQAKYFRKLDSGFESIGISTKNYSPEVVLRFGIGKRLDVVEERMQSLKEIVDIDENILKKDSITFYLIDKQGLYLKLPYASTQEGIIESTDMILNHMRTFALPIYNRFEDLRELNSLINGEGENFWENDFGNDKLINLAHAFEPRRFIIGRLSLNDSDFDILSNKVLKAWDELCLKNGWPTGDATGGGKKLRRIIEHLNKHEKCIY